MAGEKNQEGARGAPMEFPGAGGLEPPAGSAAAHVSVLLLLTTVIWTLETSSAKDSARFQNVDALPNQGDACLPAASFQTFYAPVFQL